MNKAKTYTAQKTATQQKSFARKDRKNRLIGQSFGDWTIYGYLGEGGNGSVWACRNSAGIEAAIKILKTPQEKPYNRFKDEVAVMEKVNGMQGVLPILDKFLPEFGKNITPYYVMPLAQTATNRLYNAPIEEKIEAVISIARVIEELHKQNIYHRDIKPPNMLFYNGRYCLGDFGLADFPEKQTGSVHDEVIGAKWTMAPEMKRASSSADFEKADVYSLSKTLYIILTRREQCFDGRYTTDSINDLQRFFPSTYVTSIENLLIAATDDDPDKRPTIKQLIEHLEFWKKINEDFHRRNQQEWLETQVRVLGNTGMHYAEWTDLNEIIKTLKKVCIRKHINHTFFPNHGGLDLLDARLSHEEGCIELDFEGIDIIKPKRLIYQSFGINGEWNYFRLELDDLLPLALNGADQEEKKEGHETIAELGPASYYPFHVLKNRTFDDEMLQEDWSPRFTRRWLRGNFIIVGKSSPYNLISDTYDGRHNCMSAENFRSYISSLITKMPPWFVEQNKLKFTEPSLTEKTDPITVIHWCKECRRYLNANGFVLSEEKQKQVSSKIFKGIDIPIKTITGKCCKNKKHKAGDNPFCLAGWLKKWSKDADENKVADQPLDH